MGGGVLPSNRLLHRFASAGTNRPPRPARLAPIQTGLRGRVKELGSALCRQRLPSNGNNASRTDPFAGGSQILSPPRHTANDSRCRLFGDRTLTAQPSIRQSVKPPLWCGWDASPFAGPCTCRYNERLGGGCCRGSLARLHSNQGGIPCFRPIVVIFWPLPVPGCLAEPQQVWGTWVSWDGFPVHPVLKTAAIPTWWPCGRKSNRWSA